VSGDYYIDAVIDRNLKTTSHIDLTADKQEAFTTNLLAENCIVKGTLDNKLEHDDYYVRLKAGTEYQFDLKASASSPNLDTCLMLTNLDSSRNAVENNDISGLDHNSRLFFTPTETAFYNLDVSSFRGSTMGSYTIGFHALHNLI